MSFAPNSLSEFEVPPKPRWSAIAIAGFVASFLFVLAPLGIVLGIVGIVRTSGGRRRGMGLAIAAIPIGLAVSVVSILIIVTVMFGARVMALSPLVTSCLEASRSTVPQMADKLYDQCSQELRDKVSREQFTAWASKVVEKHGSLQSTTRSPNLLAPTADGTGMALNLTGKFVNGPATISIHFQPDGINPMISDIEVDGVSPVSDKRSEHAH